MPELPQVVLASQTAFSADAVPFRSIRVDSARYDQALCEATVSSIRVNERIKGL